MTADGDRATPRSPVGGGGSEASLGVVDRGIWSDLDARVQVALQGSVTAATFDDARKLLVVWRGALPLKVYPTGAGVPMVIGTRRVLLRPGDARELADLPSLAEGPAAADRDRDGIPDQLDILIGARKTELNRDAYTGGYFKIAYPGGDVPRTIGVCTDVVIRALRNAGVDLQLELHRDLARARRAYPMVKGAGDTNIDHRRVRTLLPYFRRHLKPRSIELGDPADPLWPGDIVLMDTMPGKPGPDHIGIVSERSGASGLPYIINNWTDGTVTAEMDLLGWVPVTHRFRL